MRRSIMTLLAGGIALAACNQASGDERADGPRDDAPTVERAFAAADFDHVTLAGQHRVTIRAGDAYSVTARGSDAVLDRLEIEVDGDDLEIGNKRDSDWKFWKNRDGAIITVTMPRVAGLTLAGSGSLANEAPTAERFRATVAGSGKLATGTLAARRVALRVAGSGDLATGPMAAEQTEIDIAGSGTVRASGRAGATAVKIAGSGDVAAEGLVADAVDIGIYGSGNVAIGATGHAKVNIMGSGDVRVTGTRDCTVTKHGSGKVSCG